MKLTLESIRERFPNPRKAIEVGSDYMDLEKYCVGGAFCRWLGERDGIPDPDHLRRALQAENPRLTDRITAHDLAEAIIDANDSGDFETAWAKLGEALEFRG